MKAVTAKATVVKAASPPANKWRQHASDLRALRLGRRWAVRTLTPFQINVLQVVQQSGLIISSKTGLLGQCCVTCVLSALSLVDPAQSCSKLAGPLC